jgi:hypothetical protein
MQGVKKRSSERSWKILFWKESKPKVESPSTVYEKLESEGNL